MTKDDAEFYIMIGTVGVLTTIILVMLFMGF